MKQLRPIAVDLFAGAGGMTLGFEQAGFDVLAAVEIDPIHCATHKFNFPYGAILCQSVINTTAAEIRSKSTIGDRDIDAVIGGSPCQGFSIIGKRALCDPRNSLLFHFSRLVLELQPKFFVIENVRGLTIGKHKQFLQQLIDEFKSNAYEVEENYQILNAAQFGVPQHRERLFLIGCRQGYQMPKYPAPITKPAWHHRLPKSILASLPFSPTVWDAISDLPCIENYPQLLHQDWAIAEYGEFNNYTRQLRGISKNVSSNVFTSCLKNDYSYGRIYNQNLISSSLRTKHSLESMQRFAETPPGQREKISRFYKLHPHGICNTLRAGTDKYRGSFTSPRPIHPHQPRCITVREAARLHSYPDWFRFHVTKWHGFRQVGNSVPPLLAKAVAAEIISILGVSPVKPTITYNLGDEKLVKLNTLQAAKAYGVEY